MANEPGFTPVTTSTKATPGFTPVPSGGVDPYGFSTSGIGGGPEAEMLRRHARSRTALDAPEKQENWLIKQARGVGDAAVELAQGVPGMVKSAASFLPSSSASAMLSEKEAPTEPADVQGIVGPQVEQWKKGQATTGIESAAHYGAAMLPFAGPMAAESGESLGRGEVGRGLTYGVAAYGSRPYRAFHDAASLIERQPTIEQGKIAYVNTARAAASKLENAVNTRGVGARVKAVTDADTLDLQRTGSPGGVHTASAQAAGIAAEAQTKIPGNLYNYPAQMTLDQAKAQLTLMGRDAARMERAGKSPEAKAVWAQYDALREATQARAEELGQKSNQPFGKIWSDYSTEFKNFLKLHEGVLGHLMEGEHTAALDKLIKHSGQLPELQDWFKKYGVDMQPIEDAATEGKKLSDLTQQNSNAVMGKIKLLSRHWALGLPALAGAHYGAQAMGLGGGIGGFILPLIIAGKVAGVLDKMQVKQLLSDLKSKVAPGEFRVAPGPVGPLEQLHRTASAGPAMEEDAMEEARRRAPGAPPTEPTPQSAKEATDVEVAKRKQATSEAAMSKADVAGKVDKARKERASGVYKGSRGGSSPQSSAERKADVMSSGPKGGQDWQSAHKAAKLREYFDKKKKEGK